MKNSSPFPGKEKVEEPSSGGWQQNTTVCTAEANRTLTHTERMSQFLSNYNNTILHTCFEFFNLILEARNRIIIHRQYNFITSIY